MSYLGLDEAIVSEAIREAGVEYPAPKLDDLIVSRIYAMQSAAGWYAGRFCVEWIFGRWMPIPYERISFGYYDTRAEAQAHVDYLNTGEEE